MLQQQLTDLDFDTYFDVSTIQSAQQQPQQMFDQNRQQSIHSNQQSNNIAHLPQQQYFMPQQQQQHQPPQSQAFDTFDWCFKQQQHQQQQHLQQQSTSGTPAITPGNISSNLHDGPDYFYSAQQQSNPAMSVPTDMPARFDFNQQHRPSIMVKEEQMNYVFDDNSSLVCSLRNEDTATIPVNNSVSVNDNSNNNGLSTPMSETTFPETPPSRHSSSESNLPSPVSTSVNVTPCGALSPPLLNAFAAIDQWGKNIDKGRFILLHMTSFSAFSHGLTNLMLL